MWLSRKFISYSHWAPNLQCSLFPLKRGLSTITIDSHFITTSTSLPNHFSESSIKSIQSIDELIVTQQGLRNINRLQLMLQHAKKGGKFDQESIRQLVGKEPKHPLISVLRCPGDNFSYLWDGHHRVTAIRLSGRKFLYPDEYQLMEKTQNQLQCPNLDVMYVTPFDPRSEIRKPEFGNLKHRINEMKAQKIPEERILEFIQQSKAKYCTKRNISSVLDLIHYNGLASLLHEEPTNELRFSIL